MPVQSLVNKPGEFRATCRMYDPLTEPVKLTDEEYKAQKPPGRAKFDYGTKLWSIEARCDFATSDVEELKAHLSDVHGNRKRVMVRDDRNRMVERLEVIGRAPSQPRIPRGGRGMWRGPRLKPEGQPFKWQDHDTVKCRGCGLVVEQGRGSSAFIEAHKAACAERQDVAS